MKTPDPSPLADLLQSLFDARPDPGACFLRVVPDQRRSIVEYMKLAVTSPVGALMPFAAIVAATVFRTFWAVPVAVCVSLAFIAVACLMPFCRRIMDSSAVAAERHKRELERAAVKAEISEEHRAVLGRIETLAERVRTKSAAPDHRIDDALGLSELTASYVRLAIAHAARQRSRDTADPAMLRARLHHQTEDGSLWSNVLEMRIRHRERIERELAAIEAGMSAILEYVLLLDECSIPGVPDDVDAKLEEFVGRWSGGLMPANDLRLVIEEEEAPRQVASSS